MGCDALHLSRSVGAHTPLQGHRHGHKPPGRAKGGGGRGSVPRGPVSRYRPPSHISASKGECHYIPNLNTAITAVVITHLLGGLREMNADTVARLVGQELLDLLRDLDREELDVGVIELVAVPDVSPVRLRIEKV